MGLFKKKRDFIDLTEKYKKQQIENVPARTSSESSQPVSSFAGFFGGDSSTLSESNSSDYVDVTSSNDSVNEKRRKLAKRLSDITEKIEDISNQIYHLQQRIEVLERKSGIGY